MADIGGVLTTNVFALASENVQLRVMIQDLSDRLYALESQGRRIEDDALLSSSGCNRLSREDLRGAAEEALSANEEPLRRRLEGLKAANGEVVVEQRPSVTAQYNSTLRNRLTEGMDSSAAGPL